MLSPTPVPTVHVIDDDAAMRAAMVRCRAPWGWPPEQGRGGRAGRQRDHGEGPPAPPHGKAPAAHRGQLVPAYGTDARKIATVVAVDDVLLDLERAVSCGLIVNELVANALKHAFPQGRSGTITVRLRAAEAELSVEDDRVGLPAGLDVEDAPTLGLHLVGDLTQQLHGRLVAESGPGARFRIVFSLNDETGSA